MLVNVLKSKMQEVIVTDSSTSYEGSITIDPDLLEAANMFPTERVDINDSTNGNRIFTYVLLGNRGSGEVRINGAASRLIHKGDKIHILCFAQIPSENMPNHRAKIIYTDNNNKVTGSKYIDTIMN